MSTTDPSLYRRLGAALCLMLCACIVSGQGEGASTSVTVEAGRRAVLRCQIAGFNFPLEATWEREDGRYLATGTTYTIDSVGTQHQGTYVCRVRNTNTNAMYQTRLILSVVPGENGGSSNSIRSTPRRLENLSLNGLIFRDCAVDASEGGKWTYKWTYPDGRTFSSSILYVPNLQQSHFGVYRCTATSDSGRVLETSFNVRPTGVRPPVGGGGGALSVKIRRISIGKPFILECYVEGGSGTYTYQWLKDRKVVSTSQRLTLSEMRAGTSGQYECVVTSTQTGSSGRKTDQVRVRMKQSETKIALAPPPGPIHVVDAGKSKELHCELDQTRDTPEVANWLFYPQADRRLDSQGRPLRAPVQNIIATPSVSILVLSDLKVTDSGRYECIVMRDGRQVRREAYVLVVSDVGLEVYPGTLTYTIGVTRRNPEFHCQVDNLPGLATAIRWSFQQRTGSGARPEKALPGNAKAQIRGGVLSTSFLTVENPTMANFGYYICRAPNGFMGRGLLIVREGGGGRGRNPGVRLVVKPGTTVTVDPGATARILCFEMTRRVVPSWRYPGALASQISETTQSNNRILTFSNVRPDQDGTRFTCHYNGQNPIEVTVRVSSDCPAGQRRCRSGACINQARFCDGRPDCPDGSDESVANCAKCEPNEVECKQHNRRPPSKKCVPVHWVCDGENDCGNGFDERNCVRGVGCDKTEFRCTDGRQIPRGFLCDSEADCTDSSDESSCSNPRVVIPSGGRPQTKRVVRGTQLRLQCEAVGVGSPKIVWRYNWGFVTAEHTIDQRCVEPNRYISTLIINNVRVRDAGIYTCEALNNQGRAFGEDYVVDVSGR